MRSSSSLQTLDESSLRLLLKLPVEREIERRATAALLESTRRNAHAIRLKCSKSLVEFIRQAWHVVERDPNKRYVHGWHIDAICQHLEAITSGKLLDLGLENRLLINVPPGSMKSLILNVFWPAWEWGPAALPYYRYVCASYNDDLPLRDSRRFRTLVQSEWYQALWPTVLTSEGQYRIENDKGGVRECCSFQSIIGKRGNRILIDDPHSTTTAESDVMRAETVRVFCEDVTNRLDDPRTTAIVVIMQRLHQGDVSGAIVDRKMPYVHLRIPMEYEADNTCSTPLGWSDPRTVDGELFFPDRFPRAVVERDKAVMLDYAIACQYQQRPSPRGGGHFKKHWFEVIEALPRNPILRVRAYDLASTKKKTSPYTVGLLLDLYADGLMVIEDVRREHLSAGEIEGFIVNNASQDGYDVEIDLPQDPGQSGKFQIHRLVTTLAGYTVHWSPESGSKEDRSKPVASQAKVGNVKLLEGPWNLKFLDEAGLFPAGTFKDQIDALSRAYMRVVVEQRMGSASGIPVAPKFMDAREEGVSPNGHSR